MNSSMSPTWRVIPAIFIVYALPAVAHYLDPLFSSAQVEARQALVTKTPTVPVPHRRQEDAEESDGVPTYTVTYAPNSTCGYLSGSVEIPITCENQGRCLWELEKFRWIACSIEGKTTGLVRTKCLQKDEADDFDLCDDVCVSNTYNLLCTNDTEPYCRTYAYPKGVRDYACASTPATRVTSVDFTYDGEKYPKFDVSTYRDVDATTEVRVSTTAASSTDTVADIESAAISSATSSATADSASDKKAGGLSGGAIAGIAIGGFFGGMAVFGGIWLLWRRRQRTVPTATSTTSQEPSFSPPWTSNPPVGSSGVKSPQTSTSTG